MNLHCPARLPAIVACRGHEYLNEAPNSNDGNRHEMTVITIQTQVIGSPILLAAAVLLSELKKSGVRIMSGTASRARQQSSTKPGSRMRQRPESLRFSVLAVPYACLTSCLGVSSVTLTASSVAGVS